ncbi:MULTISPECIES: YpmS family protein [Enterococcus]|uniref:YpmS family protein n=1 Tax=Enterococcus alishanensis TaxID=1303817 RepID=A0ABS6TAV7_9ENTE|nr:YpmS family protein [Enterococcus alishanensis]MBV7390025.1 YpmS family protein [Enterococcus alishanensis]
MKKPKNIWKWAFLILIGLILGSGIFLGTRIFSQRETNLPPASEVTVTKGTSVVTMNTNKKKLNTLMSYFLNNFQKDSDVKYQFYLEDEALLTGEFPILGTKVEFSLYFEPYVMTNGNVQLKATDLSIGTLNFPVQQVMSLVEKSYDFPEWVEVNPSEQTMTIKLNQFKLQNDMYVKADHIDLVGDDIQFSLYLPSDEGDGE